MEKGKMQSVVRVSHVGLKIGKATILQDICMEMEEGHIYGFVGRNGSGKTMLMKCICGFIHVTDGEITVRGRRVGTDMDFPQDMGIIIENPGFITYYSGRKNLRLLADVNHKIGEKEICEAMELVGLDPDSRLHVGKYSLGMRQRLGLAQALMEDPSLLILDEPMNGLDTQGVEDVRKILKGLREQGKTIIMASHNMEDIEHLCDKVWRLEHGQIISTEEKK